MVDVEYDESKMWSPEERQAYANSIPEMSLFDNHIIEGDPMVEAMQALAEEGETNETLALHWKTKGNEMVSTAKKVKNKMYYDHALKYYSDAIAYSLRAMKEPCPDPEDPIDVPHLASTIYSNRAAVQLEKRNFGSCRSDCARAIKFYPNNIKAYYRGAKASLLLLKPSDARKYCEVGLRLEPSNESLQELLKSSIKEIDVESKKKRLKEMERMKKRQETNRFRKLCESKGIKFGRRVISDERVKEYEGKTFWDEEEKVTRWPVMLLYEEYGTSDFVEQMGENDAFIDYLMHMFPEDGPCCDWDERSDYKASRMDIYVAANVVSALEKPEEWHLELGNDMDSETDVQAYTREVKEEKLDCISQWWIKVSPQCSLIKLLTHARYVMPGIPLINIILRGSNHEARFLDKVQGKLLYLES